MTDAQKNELETLKTAIENAPDSPGKIAPKLAGWWTPKGWYLCAKCAGRIFERGCGIPRGSLAAWRDRPEPVGVCCLCK